MPAITDPTELSSLRAWYDMNDGTSITHSSGVTSQVNDKSGQSNHLVQATSTSRPTWDNDIGDGMGALLFEQFPNTQYMSRAGSNIVGGTTITVIALVMQETNATSRNTFSLHPTGSQEWNTVGGFYCGVETGWPDGYRNGTQLSHAPDTSDVDTDSYRIITMRFTGSQQISYTNTTAWTSVSTSGTFDVDVINLASGANGSNPSYCRFREFIVCAADLGNPSDTSSETYAAWYYLDQKWSLGLGLSAPTGGGPATVSRTGSVTGTGTLDATGLKISPPSIIPIQRFPRGGTRVDRVDSTPLLRSQEAADLAFSVLVKPATVISATASVTSTGTLTATGARVISLTATISGSGTITGTGSSAGELFFETFTTSAALDLFSLARYRTVWDDASPADLNGQDSTQGNGPDIGLDIRVTSGVLEIECGMQDYGESVARSNTLWSGNGTIEMDILGDDISPEAQVVVLILDRPYAFTSFDGENANGPRPAYGIGLYNGYIARTWSNYTQTDYYQGGSPGPPNGTRLLDTWQHWVFNFNSTHMWVTIDGADINVGATGAYSSPSRRIPIPSGFDPTDGAWISIGTHNHASQKYTPFVETTITSYDNLEYESLLVARAAEVPPSGVQRFGWNLPDSTPAVVHETTSLALGTANAARLVLNVSSDGDDFTSSSRLNYRINGGSTHQEPFALTTAANAGVHTFSIPVDVAELVDGVNDLEFWGTNCLSPGANRYANVQLVVTGGEASSPPVQRTASLSGTGTIAGSGVRVVQRTASITGTGTLAATGVEIIPRTGSISGVGSLSGSGVPVKLRSGSMSGTGTLTATGIEVIPRTASMSGTGTLSASGLELLPRTATISGTGTLTGSGVRIAARTASMSGTSTIAASGLRIAPRTATLAGTGTLTATGNAIAARSASMSGIGTLEGSWAAQGVKNASGSMSGTGTLAAAGVRIVATSGSVNGTGTLSATGIEVIPRTASLSGVGTLTGSGVRIALRTASMSGLATLTASGISIVPASGSISGTGTLSGSGIEVMPRTGAISGTGTLAATGVPVKLRTATISGLGTLNAIGSISGQYTGIVNGTGTLSGTGIRVKFRTASLAGIGTLSGTGARLALRTASFSGTGTLSGSGTRLSLKTATINGIGATTAAGTRIAPRDATITGIGTLAASNSKIVNRGGSITGAATLAASFTGVIISRTASMSGAGSMSATGVRVKTATASLAGAGVVAGSGVRVVTRTSEVTGTGSMTADYLIGQTAAGSMAGAGTLTASFMRIVRRSGTMSGTSSINAVLPVRVDYNELKSIGGLMYDQKTYRGVGTTQGGSFGSRFTGIGQTQKIR